MYEQTSTTSPSEVRVPWNKGKLTGQKPPFTLKQIWAIRIRLQIERRIRDLALFNLAIDSKLRGCDLVRLRVRDVAHGEQAVSPAMVLQQKTGRPVRFELTEQTREALQVWIGERNLMADDFLFPSRVRSSGHISTRQYARIVNAGISYRTESVRFRNPLVAANEGNADLSPHEESAGCSAIARTHQVGKHGALPRNRGRRRTGDR